MAKLQDYRCKRWQLIQNQDRVQYVGHPEGQRYIIKITFTKLKIVTQHTAVKARTSPWSCRLIEGV